MHQLIRVNRATKPTRICIATDDKLESTLKTEARKMGMVPSPYAEMVLRDHLNSRTSLRSLPITSQANHLLGDLKKAESDGALSPIEREEITDHLCDLLSTVRKHA